ILRRLLAGRITVQKAGNGFTFNGRATWARVIEHDPADLAHWFGDEPPADRTPIREEVGFLRGTIGDVSTARDLPNVLSTITGSSDVPLTSMTDRCCTRCSRPGD